ncbi:PTS sugar transporter subunit IIC [Lactobacillus sp. R2/2]|nr:PTS sugar transporter subunit IIC [Lactobacillus sp. R2/2]
MAFFPLILRLPSGILTFLVLQLGTKAAQSLIALLPTKIMTSFSVAAGLLPAVGFAMLIQMMMDKKLLHTSLLASFLVHI